MVGLLRMRDSSGIDLDTFPSAMGIVTRLACERAKQEGVEAELLLLKAGLTHRRIDDPCARLAVKSQIRFLELAATTLKDNCLGFHLAQKFDLRMIGLLHYVSLPLTRWARLCSRECDTAQSSTTHAFKRWTGKAPRAIRQASR
jgi:Arabinose-binding domain of AraC transcription regulator, N-term